MPNPTAETDPLKVVPAARTDREQIRRRAVDLASRWEGSRSVARHRLESHARSILGELGLPIAAMDTGGTSDIIRPGDTGLLAATPDAFGRDLARLAADPDLRARLGAGAAAHARAHFDASRVAARVDAVYESLIAPRRGGRP